MKARNVQTVARRMIWTASSARVAQLSSEEANHIPKSFECPAGTHFSRRPLSGTVESGSWASSQTQFLVLAVFCC